MNLNNLQSKIKEFEDKVASTKGRLDILEEQYLSSQDQLTELKETQIINSEAIELLNIIQMNNKEVIQDMFEGVVTKALQFIHQNDDYKFELEFGHRGNLPELKFNIKTPDLKESHSIMDTRAGGSKDIVALALREVLLEASKMPGFLFLDEPEKRLDSLETEEKMIEFVKEIQKETGRQLFIITHSQTMVDSVPNPIVIKCSQPSEQLEKVDIKPKRKRGRPRKENKP